MGWGPRATALGDPAQEERRAEGSREQQGTLTLSGDKLMWQSQQLLKVRLCLP